MKNLLLLLAMLITTSTVFSQLFVRPNPTTSTDSYVYVNDEVLFVEQDVNLEENTNNVDTEASIYLRNDGQLIQGATASNNNGTGSLSVYQTIDSTSYYHYTFWHSPVGLPAGAAGNTMTGVSRLYDADAGHLTRSNQVLTTTSQNGSDGNPITISTNWFYKRLSSASNEVEALYQHVGTSNNVEPHYGFIMKGIGSDPGAGFNSQTYDFRGRPYNGDINVPIIASPSTNPNDDKWVLTGNPYASALDLKLFYNDNIVNGIRSILYWDEPKDSEFHHDYDTHTGGYGVWIPGLGTGPDDPGEYTKAPFRAYDESSIYGPDMGILGDDYNRRYAPIGQGFVVQTNSSVADNIEFRNSQRVFRKIGDVSDMRFSEENDNSSNSLGDNNSTNSIGDNNPTTNLDGEVSAIITPKLRLHIEYVNGPTRELLLIFHENSTNGYDPGLDAPLPINPEGTDAYFPIIMADDGIGSFAIQTMPYSNDIVIPIAFFTNDQRFVRVNADEIINFSRKVYLWDSQEDIYREIKENTDNINYSFILPTGMYDDRYFIVFKNSRMLLEDSEVTKLKEEVRASVGFFQNNPYKQMEVSNPEGYDIKSAIVFDMTGKMVASRNNLGTESNFNISTSNLADGVYLVKVTTLENIDIDYKMIIKNN